MNRWAIDRMGSYGYAACTRWNPSGDPAPSSGGIDPVTELSILATAAIIGSGIYYARRKNR